MFCPLIAPDLDKPRGKTSSLGSDAALGSVWASNQSAFRPTTFAIELSFQKTLVQAFPAEPVPSATSNPTPKIRTFIT